MAPMGIDISFADVELEEGLDPLQLIPVNVGRGRSAAAQVVEAVLIRYSSR